MPAGICKWACGAFKLPPMTAHYRIGEYLFRWGLVRAFWPIGQPTPDTAFAFCSFHNTAQHAPPPSPASWLKHTQKGTRGFGPATYRAHSVRLKSSERILELPNHVFQTPILLRRPVRLAELKITLARLINEGAQAHGGLSKESKITPAQRRSEVRNAMLRIHKLEEYTSQLVAVRIHCLYLIATRDMRQAFRTLRYDGEGIMNDRLGKMWGLRGYPSLSTDRELSSNIEQNFRHPEQLLHRAMTSFWTAKALSLELRLRDSHEVLLRLGFSVQKIAQGWERLGYQDKTA
ncbi:hypothetical protein NUW58_g3156 [Xylaria curta]|uniref:Uncharacterized protein n=1 Tax=Xylaria curta TaxID=42375 RepID=A0ACC1PCA0_9PEZI|nr:hypothetical protein NUW58_g3156 [Xylaria curta]